QDEVPLTASERQQLTMRSSDGVITRPMMNGSNIVITNAKGKTISSFSVQDHRICFLRYKPTEDTILPVEVITFDQARQALDLAKLRNQIFLGIYLLEGLAVVIWYALGKRRKAT